MTIRFTLSFIVIGSAMFSIVACSTMYGAVLRIEAPAPVQVESEKLIR